jgi:hypothetical protein
MMQRGRTAPSSPDVAAAVRRPKWLLCPSKAPGLKTTSGSARPSVPFIRIMTGSDNLAATEPEYGYPPL